MVKTKEVPWPQTKLYKVVKQTSDKGIRYAIYEKDDNSTGATLLGFEIESIKKKKGINGEYDDGTFGIFLVFQFQVHYFQLLYFSC